MSRILRSLIFFMMLLSLSAHSSLVDTISKIKPSVVGIGVYTPTGRPKNQLFGSGFVIGDGTYIVTNKHVIAQDLDDTFTPRIGCICR